MQADPPYAPPKPALRTMGQWVMHARGKVLRLTDCKVRAHARAHCGQAKSAGHLFSKAHAHFASSAIPG